MLYHLFTYLDENFRVPGAGLFKYYSFRTAMAIITSLFISLFIGKKIINYLKSKQISDEIRELGLNDAYDKSSVPTMGGIIIILSILIPTLLFANLTNVYVILIIISTIWLGLLGFLDDYIKVFRHNKAGLRGKFKIIGQVLLGIIIGTTLYFSKDVVVRKPVTEVVANRQIEVFKAKNHAKVVYNEKDKIYQVEMKSTKTTIPFVKNNEFDYADLLKFVGKDYEKWAYLIYIPIIIFLITAVSNGANLTDGLDGLNAGISTVIVFTLAIFAYVSGNIIFANYLNIMYIPNLGEMTIFAGAMIGAGIGFLWFNAYPAQVFMGDTGSLPLGGLIAILAIIIRKELLIPLLCGIFLIESLSVIIQVGYFKYSRKIYGEGRRIFKMSPIHHHFQKSGYPEPKIVARFWIVGIILAVLTFITLKIR
jgi:phospho-N-acetylmuramoyl-pentapeptide-transferase